MPGAVRTVIWTVCAVLLLSCEEHLPLRSDPTTLLQGRMDTEYIVSIQSNALLLRFVLVNTYDEVVEGISLIDGTIALSLARDPSVTRTFDLSAAQLQYARDFNPITNFLRIMPGDSIVFKASFDYVDDAGRDLFEYLPFSDDPSCPGRFVSHRETYLVRAQTDVFPRIATVVATPHLVEVCFVRMYVAPNDCTPVVHETSACLDRSVAL